MSKKTLEITLYMSEIIYDVRNKSFLTGRSRNNGDINLEEVANMQASEDDEDMNQILRSIGSAVDALKSGLSEYMTAPSDAPSNKLIEPNVNISIQLSMPSNYNESVGQSIATSAHQFVVCSALSEWFLITNKADAGDYDKLAGEHLAVIRTSINKRVRPVRQSV